METPRHDASAPHHSRPELLLAVFATSLMLENHSRLPEANFFVVIFCSLATLGLGIAYIARLARISQLESTSWPRRHRLLNWIVFPFAVALMLSSSATHWPAMLRFNLSKSRFEELVEQAYTGHAPQGFPRRVGLFWIDYVQDSEFNYETRGGRIGFVTGVALVDECGIYYDEKDPKSTHWLTTRIAPCWYLTEW